MKTKVFIARAGSGKSTYATQNCSEFKNKRVLYITYTQTNVQVLRKKLRVSPILFRFQKVMSWFDFILKEIIYPTLGSNLSTKKIDWDRNAWHHSNWMNERKELYGYKCSKIALNEAIFTIALRRLNKFYDYLVIDEFQDITGEDLILLKKLINATLNLQIQIYMFGDLYQANVQHSNTTSLFKNTIQIANEEEYLYKTYGNSDMIIINKHDLLTSHRIGRKIADFISQRLNIEIHSENEIGQVLPENMGNIPQRYDEVAPIFNNVSKILVYNSKVLESEKYQQYRDKTVNWGVSKGETYEDIAVVLTKKIFEILTKNEGASVLKAQTLNKFYVALTRASGDVYLVYPSKVK